MKNSIKMFYLSYFIQRAARDETPFFFLRRSNESNQFFKFSVYFHNALRSQISQTICEYNIVLSAGAAEYTDCISAEE